MIKFDKENDRVYADVFAAELGTKEWYIAQSILGVKEVSRDYTKYMNKPTKENHSILEKVTFDVISLIENCVDGLRERIGNKQDADLGTLVDIVESFNAKDVSIDEELLEFL